MSSNPLQDMEAARAVHEIDHGPDHRSRRRCSDARRAYGTGGMKDTVSRGACGFEISTHLRPCANRAMGISVLRTSSQNWCRPV